VLLVEDDESVRRLGKKILENAGYWVYEAKDGLEAMKMAEDLRDRIDLLVTDVVMPHMSGRQLAEKLKAVLPQLKVLFVSGYTDQAFAHFGDLTQGDGFLQKPFTAAGIIRRISEILQQ
jgi:CheY-like chemotaxis protein